MNIVERASVVNKWFDRDPTDHKYIFLMMILGFAVLLLPLTGLFIISSNQSTRINAQISNIEGVGPMPPLPVCGEECTSMTVSWSRPSALAQFVDSRGRTTTCTGDGLSCMVSGVFTPNSDINYTVRVKNTTGAIIKAGTDKVTPKKQATASWSWKYAVAVFPSSYRDCIEAGIHNECLIKTVANDYSQNSVVYNNVKAATEYMVYVCAPNCGEGTAILQTKQTTPAFVVPIVSPIPSPTSQAYCRYVGSSVVQPGLPLAVSHSGFAEGESVVLSSATGISPVALGKTISSLGGVQTQQFATPTTLVFGSYQIKIVTRFPIVNFPCGDVGIFAPSATQTPVAY